MLNYFVPEDGDSSDHMNVLPLPRVDQLRLLHVKKVGRSACSGSGSCSPDSRTRVIMCRASRCRATSISASRLRSKGPTVRTIAEQKTSEEDSSLVCGAQSGWIS